MTFGRRGSVADDGWVIRFDGAELHESDVRCVHLWNVIQVVGDTFQVIDPGSSPLCMMAWVAAAVAHAADIDFEVARGAVAAARAEDVFAAYIPKG